MWPETEKVVTESRHELVLSGKEISNRILENGFDLKVFQLISLNYLNINQTIFSEIPDEIANLVNLQTLVLHSNKLEVVSEMLSKLDKLKILDLSGNAINRIPECLGDLHQLVTLNLSGNKLGEFPSTFNKCTKLTVLDLSNNCLKFFPNICSEEMVNLAELKLMGNQIEEIPNTICLLPILKVFDVSSNKIKALPGELADCQKLKELNLKINPVSDRRLLKLIDQCRTKQVLDYIKQHCPRTLPDEGNNVNKGKNRKKKYSEETDEEENGNTEYKYSIKVLSADERYQVVMMNAVKIIREHIVCCVINNIKFTEESFKKFIQLQNKLHDTLCEKRNTATIATHDFMKLPPGNLVYTTLPPKDLIIKPLNRPTAMTGAAYFSKLQTEANNLRKEKKRSTYSGIHKYLYLIEGKPQYPCLLNGKEEVISFPPLTNSDISKIDLNTTQMLIEVTSANSHFVCKTILDALIREMVLLFQEDLEIRPVKIIDHEGHLKNMYPSKTDLKFDKSIPIKIDRN